jgi:hypothetical protein
MDRTQQKLELYLAPWQKRMMKDFMSSASFKKPFAKITKLVIFNPKRPCLVSYKIPNLGMRRGDWIIYLTDEQMKIVQEKIGLRTPISSINISPDFLKNGTISFE